jgi:transcriptional regulator GlxA family with amidase domain
MYRGSLLSRRHHRRVHVDKIYSWTTFDRFTPNDPLCWRLRTQSGQIRRVIDPHECHRVAIVVLPGIGPLDFGTAVASFGIAPYTVIVCGEAGVQALRGGLTITPGAGLNVLDTVDTIVVPGYLPETLIPSPDVVAALQRAHRRGARIAANSLGVFALAHAGLLDGLAATTHWAHLEALASQFPSIDVRRDALYVRSGNIHTSAGAAAGLDLFIDMIREDLGEAAAGELRRQLVASPPRAGEHRQPHQPLPLPPTGDSVATLCAWILANFEEPMTLADIAAHANMSVRNFSRRFVAETGVTPMKWLQAARINHARELLETTDRTTEDIARRCGMGSRANFRRIFIHQVGLTPAEYRISHRGARAMSAFPLSDLRAGQQHVTEPVALKIATPDISSTGDGLAEPDEISL